MDYRDEMVRQRIKHIVEQGGYADHGDPYARLFIALTIVCALAGGALYEWLK